MARREVTEDDVPMGVFLKTKELFAEDGDSFVGLYKGSGPSTGQFGGTNYTFKQRDGSFGTLTVKGLLEKLLAKAAPVEGEKVTITRTGSKDVGKASDMILFKVNIDDAPQKKTAPKPPPKPARVEDAEDAF
jgi:hypothetical protein